jgi:hypothetical protein
LSNQAKARSAWRGGLCVSSNPIEVVTYQGATTHDFGDPAQSRQSVPANREALDDVLQRAIAIVEGFKN